MMEGFLDEVDALDARQFEIVLRRLADDFNYGSDASVFLGSGIEYAQSRPYQHGDSIRTIDWRVTARTGKFHVKEYEATKRIPCYLLLDTSASMAVSSQRLSKYALAVQLAGGLALACLERAMPIGVLGIGSGAVHVRPSMSRGQVMQWMHRLRRFDYGEETLLARRLVELGPGLTSRALLIVISDLHDPSGVLALKQLGQKHDCVVLQLRDPAERGISGAGFVRAREAETGREFLFRGRNAGVDSGETRGMLRRAGIDHLLIDTDQASVHRIRNFLAGRNLLVKGAR